MDLKISITNGIVYTKIYKNREDFDFDIVNFPFLDGDVPRRISYWVSISQLILHFVRASLNLRVKKGKRKAQGVPPSQTAVVPRHQEEGETNKTKEVQIDQTYKKH